ncbi:MAG: 50S ribosomal protein L18 [Candidatus Helarchaeota archaeon]
MAKGPKYRVRFKRHRNGKTNYYLRKRLIQSNLPRIVIRKSNKYILIQLIEAQIEGDRILSSTNSKELIKKYDWGGSCNSIPTAYLTGYLAGLKINASNNIEKAILDLGLQKITYGSKLFSALKGLVDADINIPHSDKIFPPEERISGEHIQSIANSLYDTDPDRYKKQFSLYLKNNFDPRNYVELFNKTLKKIQNSFN